MATQQLGSFLFSHLSSLGARHCFGLPGDYVLPLYDSLTKTDGIEAVVGTHEPAAGFSADAYGRIRGLGVLVLTYGVGGFNALNAVAGAYAESSPLLVISGGPQSSTTASPFEPVRHHIVKEASDQLEVFRRVTDLAVRIESAETAASTIRKAAAHAMRAKRPVYLEVPSELMRAEIDPGEDSSHEPSLDEEALEHAVGAFAERIASARRPLLLVGVDVARHGLRAEVEAIMEARGIPAAVTPLGKGALAETTPGVLGVYAGVLSPTVDLRSRVESSDLVVLIGTKVTDVNCGAYTADLNRDSLLVANSEWVGDGFQRYSSSLPLPLFLRRLAHILPPLTSPPELPEHASFPYGQSDSAMDRFLGVVDDFATSGDIIVADTGDALYGSLFMRTARENGYLASTFYNTMGFAVPAALGAQLADSAARPIVLVGDGAFQMTGLELSNMVRYGLDPIVVLFNNAGFGMQRIFNDGPFNDIAPWKYGAVTELVGGGVARRVDSPKALATALAEARARRNEPSLIEVVVEQGSTSTGLDLLAQAFTREKTGACPMAGEGAEGCAHQGSCAFCRAPIWR